MRRDLINVRKGIKGLVVMSAELDDIFQKLLVGAVPPGSLRTLTRTLTPTLALTLTLTLAVTLTLTLTLSLTLPRCRPAGSPPIRRSSRSPPGRATSSCDGSSSLTGRATGRPRSAVISN